MKMPTEQQRRFCAVLFFHHMAESQKRERSLIYMTKLSGGEKVDENMEIGKKCICLLTKNVI